MLVRFGRARRRLRASPGARNDGGGVLGSLYWRQLTFIVQENDRGQPVAATTAAFLAWLGHTRHQGSILDAVIIRFPRAAAANEVLLENIYFELQSPAMRADITHSAPQGACSDG